MIQTHPLIQNQHPVCERPSGPVFKLDLLRLKQIKSKPGEVMRSLGLREQGSAANTLKPSWIQTAAEKFCLTLTHCAAAQVF